MGDPRHGCDDAAIGLIFWIIQSARGATQALPTTNLLGRVVYKLRAAPATGNCGADDLPVSSAQATLPTPPAAPMPPMVSMIVPTPPPHLLDRCVCLHGGGNARAVDRRGRSWRNGQHGGSGKSNQGCAQH